MTEKKRRLRRPKIKKLADGSTIIDGFIAPPPRVNKPEPMRFAPYDSAPNSKPISAWDTSQLPFQNCREQLKKQLEKQLLFESKQNPPVPAFRFFADNDFTIKCKK